MLSHNNWEEQIKKYEPKKQRFTIKKLSVGVASVLLGVTFAAGTASADSTTANADSASGSDSPEQTDHNLTLNSASTSTLKSSATAENQSNNASAAVQNPAGDIKAQAANDYELLLMLLLLMLQAMLLVKLLKTVHLLFKTMQPKTHQLLAQAHKQVPQMLLLHNRLQ